MFHKIIQPLKEPRLEKNKQRFLVQIKEICLTMMTNLECFQKANQKIQTKTNLKNK